MKKISILTLSLGYGGIEKSVTSLANLLSHDYDITIVSAYEIDKPVYELERNIKILYLKKGLKPDKEIKNKCKNKLFSYIKKLINNYKIEKETKKLMIDYIKNVDTDVIISTKNIYNLWITKYAKSNIKKIGIDGKDFTNKKYVDKVIKYSKDLDYFVTVSEEQNKFYKQYFNDKTIYIPNFVENESILTSSLNENRILFVGVLSKDKGIYDLIDVFKKVNHKHKDWILDIVGGGSEYNNLLKKIEKENLNINLHGFKNQKYIERLYLNSSIYVMTSCKEVFNLTILEALSYGIPCVAFDRSIGCKSIITDNYDGYLVKYSDKDKMARRINELIENPNRRIIMGRNAHKKVLKYDKNDIKKIWNEIID